MATNRAGEKIYKLWYNKPATPDLNGYLTESLPIGNGYMGVSYDYNGVTYSREYFATYPDKVTVIRLTASEVGALTFTMRPEAVFTNDYFMPPR